MKTLKQYIVSILLVSFTLLASDIYSQESEARVTSVGDLLQHCTAETGQTTCEIYTQAVHDFYFIFQNSGDKNSICIENLAPYRKTVVSGFIAWAKENPEYLSRPASSAISTYLSLRFPCGSVSHRPPAAPPSATPIKPVSSFDDAKSKCSDLGFKKGTDQFGTCVLKLTK